MNEEEALKEIIRSCDGKTSAHYRSIIAATFGLFGLLSLLKGQGRMPTSFSSSILSFLYFILLSLVFYALARSIHYTKMAQDAMGRISEISLAKGDVKAPEARGNEKEPPKAPTLSNLWSDVYDTACDKSPRLIKDIMVYRKEHGNFVYSLVGIAFILSFILWLAVLFLPSP